MTISELRDKIARDGFTRSDLITALSQMQLPPLQKAGLFLMVNGMSDEKLAAVAQIAPMVIDKMIAKDTTWLTNVLGKIGLPAALSQELIKRVENQP